MVCASSPLRLSLLFVEVAAHAYLVVLVGHPLVAQGGEVAAAHSAQLLVHLLGVEEALQGYGEVAPLEGVGALHVGPVGLGLQLRPRVRKRLTGAVQLRGEVHRTLQALQLVEAATRVLLRPLACQLLSVGPTALGGGEEEDEEEGGGQRGGKGSRSTSTALGASSATARRRPLERRAEALNASSAVAAVAEVVPVTEAVLHLTHLHVLQD